MRNRNKAAVATVLAALFAAAGFVAGRRGGDSHPSPSVTSGKAPAEATALYHCPMHKEVVSKEPGKCPKCGMKLMLKP